MARCLTAPSGSQRGFAMPSVGKQRTLREEIPVEGDGTTQLGFRFHARALAALGRDLVTDDVVAVIELVKNAYDALAIHVDVRIRPAGTEEAAPYIEVSDDGHGMDYATIRDVWCVIATPHKQETPVSRIGPRARHVTGEKGLGRLSAARLGSKLDAIQRAKSGIGDPVAGMAAAVGGHSSDKSKGRPAAWERPRPR